MVPEERIRPTHRYKVTIAASAARSQVELANLTDGWAVEVPYDGVTPSSVLVADGRSDGVAQPTKFFGDHQWHSVLVDGQSMRKLDRERHTMVSDEGEVIAKPSRMRHRGRFDVSSFAHP